MKNKILLIGNRESMREEYRNNNYYICPKNDLLDKLYKEYDVTNLSKDNLDFNNVSSILNRFLSKFKYESCVIVISGKKIISRAFIQTKNVLQNVINMISSFGVKPIVVSSDNSSISNELIESLDFKL